MGGDLKVLLCVFACGAALLAGCGDDGDGGDGPLTESEFVSQADAVCAESTKEQARIAASEPFYYAGGAAKWEGIAGVLSGSLSDLEEIEPPRELADAFREYLAARRTEIEIVRRLAAAATDVNERLLAGKEAGAPADEYAQASERLDKTYAQLERLERELGFEVCGASVEPETELTGTEPPEGTDFLEPTNTLEQAAEDFLAAVESKKCSRINAQAHSDNRPIVAQGCKQIADAFGGARIVLSEQHGPAGAVEIRNERSNSTLLFVQDTDGALRQAGDMDTPYGGLRPANEDNDAEQSADDWVRAVRENDPELYADASEVDIDPSTDFANPTGPFNFIGPADGTGRDLVADIRADEEAAPVLLGINQAVAFFLLDADDGNWVLVFDHEQGSPTAYGWAGFFPVADQ